jgi:hypothetical protein
MRTGGENTFPARRSPETIEASEDEAGLGPCLHDYFPLIHIEAAPFAPGGLRFSGAWCIMKLLEA